MAQKKLRRFNEIKTFPNVLEYPEGMAGNWQRFFQNPNPLVLELACGKGEYATGLAQLYPGKNYVGVDIKGNRLWVGAKYAMEHHLDNVAFLRTQIGKIADYFTGQEVDEIWITFPDPQLRGSKAEKRLTHPRFLRAYGHILKPGAKIHLKTDSPDLYAFTRTVAHLYQLKVHTEIDNVRSMPKIPRELEIKTHYEQLDIAGSQRIFYLCFSLPPELPDKDEELRKLIREQPRA